MKKGDCLPRGYDFINKLEYEKKHRLISALLALTKQDCLDFIEIPPLGYLNNFKSGADIIGDKAYEFLDKKGRQLVLTPDAQVHIFNHYLCTQQGKVNRIAWLSPIFRYRHAPARHFHQCGFASVNYSNNRESGDLMYCLSRALDIVHTTSNATVHIQVVNPAILLEVLTTVYGIQNGRQQYDRMRKLKPNELTKLIHTGDYDEGLRRIITALLHSKGAGNCMHLEQFKEYRKTMVFYNKVKELERVNAELNLALQYSSEILSGIGFTLDIEGDKIGDGGIYSEYANRYNPRLQTFASVCLGLRATARHVPVDAV